MAADGSTSVDSISIDITASGDDASRGIQSVIDKLGDLDKKVSGSDTALDKLGGDFASKVAPVVTAIEGLAKYSGALDGLSSKLSGLADGMASLSEVKPQVAVDAGKRVSDLAAGMGSLEGVDGGKLRSLSDALGSMPGALKAVGDDSTTLDQVRERLDGVAQAAQRASKTGTGMANLAQGLKGIPDGLDKFANIDGYAQKVENFGTVVSGLVEQLSGFGVEARQNATAIKNLGDGLTKLSMLGADTKSLEANLSGAGSAVAKFVAEVSGVNASADTMHTLSASVRSLAKSLTEIPSALSSMGSFDTYAESLRTFRAVIERIIQTLGLFDDESRKSAAALKNVSQSVGSLSKLGASADEVRSNLQAAVPVIADFAKSLASSVDDATLARFTQLADAISKVTQAYAQMGQAKHAADASGGTAQTTKGPSQSDVDSARGDIANKAMAAANGIAGAYEKAFGIAQSVASRAGAAIQSGLSAAWGAATRAAQTYLGVMQQIAYAPIEYATSKVQGLADALHRIGSMAVSAVFYNSLFAALGAAVDGVTLGIQNLYQWALLMGDGFVGTMDSCATSLQYFQNSIGAAASSLLDALAPALETIVNYAVAALNAINQLLAALTGHSTWRRARRAQVSFAKSAYDTGSASDDEAAATDSASSAMDDYASSTKKATKEAKKYQNTVMGFDELNRLNPRNEDSGSGSSPRTRKPKTPKSKKAKAPKAGADIPDYGSMFEDVPIDDYFKDLAKTDDWTKLGEDLAEKINSWEKSIDWDSIDKTAAKWSKRIWTAFNGFVAKRDWASFGYTIGRGINVGLHFIDDIAQHANFTGFGAGLAAALNHAVSTMDWPALGRVMTDGLKVSLEILHGFMNSAEGNSTYEKFNFDGLRDHLNEAIDAAFGNIDWQTALTDITDFFGEVGLTFVSGINRVAQDFMKEVDRIDWTSWGGQIAGYLNRAVQMIDWPNLGRTLVSGLKVALDALHGIMNDGNTYKGFNFDLLRDKMNQAIDAAFGSINFQQGIMDVTAFFGEVATTFVSGVSRIAHDLDDAVQHTDWNAWGVLVAQKLNDAIKAIDWGSLGRFLTDGLKIALEGLHGALDEMDRSGFWDSLGNDISYAITEAFNNIDWAQAGTDINRLANHILDVVEQALDAINWDDINQFIENLHIDQLIGRALEILAKNVGKAITNSFENGTWPFVMTYLAAKVAPFAYKIAKFFLDLKTDKGILDAAKGIGELAGKGIVGGTEGGVAAAGTGTGGKVAAWLTEHVGGAGTTTAATSVGTALGSALGTAVGVGLDIDGMQKQLSDGFSVSGMAETIGGAALTGASIGLALGHPIIGAGIGAAVGVGEEIVANWGPISDWVGQNVGQPVAQKFGEMGDAINDFNSNVGTNVSNAFSSAGQHLSEFGTNCANWWGARASEAGSALGDIGQGIAEFFTGTPAEAKESMDETTESVQTGTQTIGDSLSTWFSDRGTEIGTWFSDRGADIGNFFTNAGTTIGTGLSGFQTGLTDFSATTLPAIQTWLTDRGTDIGNFFLNAGTTIGAGLTDFQTQASTFSATAVPAIQTWLGDRWTDVTNFFTNAGTTVGTGLTGFQTSVDTFNNTVGPAVQTWIGNRATDISTFFTNAGTTVSTGISGFQTNVDNFNNTVGPAVQTWLGQRWSDVQTFFNNSGDKVSTGLSGMKSNVDTFNSTVGTATSTWLGQRWSDAQRFMGNLMTNASTGLSNVRGTVSTFGGQARSLFTTMFNAVTGSGRTFASNLVSSFRSASSGAVSQAQSLASSVRSKLSGLASNALSWGRGLASNFASGISAGIGWVAAAAERVAAAARARIHFSQPDVGPLSDFNTYAPDMMREFADGIKKNGHLVTDSLDLVTEDMSATMQVEPDVPSYQRSTPSGQAAVADAMAQALGMMGGQQQGQGDIVVQIDGREVFRAVVDENNRSLMRTGMSPLMV